MNEEIKYDYTCKKRWCEYCYQTNKKERPQTIPKPVVIKKYRYIKPKSLTQPHYPWSQEEKDLLLSQIDVPTSLLIIEGAFKERTHSSLDTQKTLLRKQYGIQVKKRNMRIHHQ